MDYRRWCRIAEWAVVAAVVLLHLAVFLWPERGNSGFVLAAAHDAQLMSAIVLMLAWGVLGPGPWWMRVAALPVLVVLWFLPWNSRMSPRAITQEIAIQPALALAAGILVAGIRACGLSAHRMRFGERERGAQFSLWGLLVATTLIAAAIGVLEWLRPTLSTVNMELGYVVWFRQATPDEGAAHYWQSPQGVRQAVLAVVIAASALGGVWIVLRPGAIWLRLAALGVLTPLVALYLTHVSDVPKSEVVGDVVSLAYSFALIAALAGLTALPLRLMGFRLGRRAKREVAVVARPIERQRLVERAAAVLGLLLLALTAPLAGILIARFGAGLEPPSEAFAQWTEARRRREDLMWIIDVQTFYTRIIPYDVLTVENTADGDPSNVLTLSMEPAAEARASGSGGSRRVPGIEAGGEQR